MAELGVLALQLIGESSAILDAMERRRTPQDKKILSYLKDRRNSYGEHDKGSRKTIPARKAWVNRTYRHAVKQITRTEVDEIDELSKRCCRRASQTVREGARLSAR